MTFLYIPIEEHTRFMIALVRARALDTTNERRARSLIHWVATHARHEQRDEIEWLLGESLPADIRGAPAHYASDEHRAKCATAYAEYMAQKVPFKNGDPMIATLSIDIPDIAVPTPDITALEHEVRHLMPQSTPTPKETP